MRIQVESTETLPSLKSIDFYCRGIELGESCFWEIFFEDEYGIHVSPSALLCMEGNDYQNWGTVDIPYVVDWILEKLGMTEKVNS